MFAAVKCFPPGNNGTVLIKRLVEWVLLTCISPSSVFLKSLARPFHRIKSGLYGWNIVNKKFTKCFLATCCASVA